MAKYKPGQKYIRNVDTKAVFQYRERIATLPKMEVLVADGEGNLVKPDQRPQSVDKLNPTKTPEKKTEPTRPQTPPGNKQPTLKPATPD